jgi:hypothetical protein
MPRYFREIEVPAGTTQAQAVEVEIEVDERFIQDAMAYIDPGAKNQVSVELIAGQKRLFPTDDSDAFRVPEVTDTAPIQVLLPSTPNTLRWRAFAPDTNNDHIVLVFFDTEDRDTRVPLRHHRTDRPFSSVRRSALLLRLPKPLHDRQGRHSVVCL